VPFIPQQRDWDDHDSEALDKPILPSGNLYTRAGTLMRIDEGYVSWLRDRNGNALRFYFEAMPGSGTNLKRVIRITDSLNRDINIQYGDYSQPDTINYGGFGTTRTIKVQRTRLNVALQDGDFLRTLLQVYPEADFLLHNITELYSPEVFSGIEFPDGRTYTFKYNALAEPTKVTKPDGSVTTYEYAGGTVNLNAAYKGGALTFRLCDPAYQIPDGFGGTQMEVN